jgi:hypothetical protein
MHGAGGGQKAGPTHPQYQHGGYNRDALEMRWLVTALTLGAWLLWGGCRAKIYPQASINAQDVEVGPLCVEVASGP